jgi:signal transduction histidine kinase
LVVEIADDGVGFDPQKTTPLARVAPGQGLDSMRALIEGLGGTFHLDTAPGRGTRVVFRLPLPVVAT